MVLLKIAVKDNRLIKVRDRLIIEDTINGVDCHFEFRSDWSALKTTVVLARGHIYPATRNPQTITVSLDDNNECTVPPEIISERGEFSIGLIGENDKTRIVTNWLYYQANLGCYDVITSPNPPTPSEYDKILGALNNKSDINHKHDEYITDEEMASALEGVKKYADDNDSDTKYGIEYDSNTNKIKLVDDVSKNEIDVADFVHKGLDGVSVTHSWNGTVLTITSASGTSSSDLKGAPGEKGRPGLQGEPGKDGYTPIKGVDYFDGRDGYTPVKGVDYFDGQDGAPGKDGQDGATPTIEISDDGYWVINGVKTEHKAVGTDNATGNGGTAPTIEISADGYWVINGVKTEYKAIATDGKDGVDGKDGYTPIKGVDYFDGEPGEDGKDGADGKDGSNGVDGYTPIKGVDYFDGKDGISASHTWNGTTLTITSASGTSSANLKGTDGKDGIDGKDGYTPVKGVDYFDGAPGNDGKDGEDGADGIGIQTATVDANGNLVVTLTNGTVLDLGNVKGADGENGKDGQDGSNGKDGQDGAPGKDGVAPTIEIREDGYWYIDGVNTNVKAQGSDGKSARISEIALTANGWNGDASPYSQVVSIDGVTENSQVDLTPSVQQLAIFYEKDLAFVTENEDGVVTVYAIGQKPMNDYTIQVTITEVDI